MRAPFLVLALPRSRTAWLSKFLTYRDWACGHDELKHVRQLEDVKSWLAQENTGTVETIGAPWWRLALKYRPDLRVAVVRRDPEAVTESLVRCGLVQNPDLILPVMKRLDRKLGQIAKRVPGALQVQYEDLASEDGCARLFEHCLPYAHDSRWWAERAAENVQINAPALLRYCAAYQPQLDRVRAIARQVSLSQLSAGRKHASGGLTIQEDDFDTFYRDGAHLFRDHLTDVEEHPEAFADKNTPLMRDLYASGRLQVVTARCNGKIFGYLMTVVARSLESHTDLTAQHTTFYASPDCPGLGLKLQRASADFLRAKGVRDVIMRAGPRGSGPRMSALYRRQGAGEFGQLFRLEL